MTDDIILRAAKAISPEWDRMSANSRRNAVLTVRGVLKAIREPTDKMLCNAWHNTVASQAIWQAMIDEVLKEGE